MDSKAPAIVENNGMDEASLSVDAAPGGGKMPGEEWRGTISSGLGTMLSSSISNATTSDSLYLMQHQEKEQEQQLTPQKQHSMLHENHDNSEKQEHQIIAHSNDRRRIDDEDATDRSSVSTIYEEDPPPPHTVLISEDGLAYPKIRTNSKNSIEPTALHLATSVIRKAMHEVTLLNNKNGHEQDHELQQNTAREDAIEISKCRVSLESAPPRMFKHQSTVDTLEDCVEVKQAPNVNLSADEFARATTRDKFETLPRTRRTLVFDESLEESRSPTAEQGENHTDQQHDWKSPPTYTRSKYQSNRTESMLIPGPQSQLQPWPQPLSPQFSTLSKDRRMLQSNASSASAGHPMALSMGQIHTFVNDDHLFPDAVTPSKVEIWLGRTLEQNASPTQKLNLKNCSLSGTTSPTRNDGTEHSAAYDGKMTTDDMKTSSLSPPSPSSPAQTPYNIPFIDDEAFYCGNWYAGEEHRWMEIGRTSGKLHHNTATVLTVATPLNLDGNNTSKELIARKASIESTNSQSHHQVKTEPLIEAVSARRPIESTPQKKRSKKKLFCGCIRSH